MSTESIRYPKCNGVMVQGFYCRLPGVDFFHVSNWVGGAAGKLSWFGMIVPAPAEKCIQVVTFRCSVCCFLKSYAHPKFAAK